MLPEACYPRGKALDFLAANLRFDDYWDVLGDPHLRKCHHGFGESHENLGCQLDFTLRRNLWGA
jgi:hypothetical protein